MKERKSAWLVYAVPIAWFILGTLYARSLEPWADIGMMLLVIVSTGGLLVGSIFWHITRKAVYGIVAAILSTAVFFFLLILLARAG